MTHGTNWWDELSADDAADPGTQIRDLLQVEKPDTRRISKLWCLLHVLGRQHEMTGSLERIENARPRDCAENIELASKWIAKHEEVIRELKSLESTLSHAPGNYASVAKEVDALHGNLERCAAEIKHARLKDKSRIPIFPLRLRK